MTPRDADPLVPLDYDHIWAEGYDAGWNDAPRGIAYIPPRRQAATAGLVALSFILGAVVAAAVTVSVVHAAPRSASAPSIPVAAQARSGAPQDGNSGRWFQGGQGSVETGGAPHLTTSGIASWYHASGMVAAAGPGLRQGHWRGSSVVVSANGRSVTVRLSDWCACPGRLIDLSDDAFRQLAPLSRGLVRVSVAAAIPLPATDTAEQAEAAIRRLA